MISWPPGHPIPFFSYLASNKQTGKACFLYGVNSIQWWTLVGGLKWAISYSNYSPFFVILMCFCTWNSFVSRHQRKKKARLLWRRLNGCSKWCGSHDHGWSRDLRKKPEPPPLTVTGWGLMRILRLRMLKWFLMGKGGALGGPWITMKWPRGVSGKWAA